MSNDRLYTAALESCIESALARDVDLRVWRSQRRAEPWGVAARVPPGVLAERIWIAPDDVPGLPSLATGAALAGLRLIVECASAEELLESAEELVLEMGELCRLSNRGLPIVFRAWLRPTSDVQLGRLGAHPLLLRCPWLDVLAPGSVADAVSLLAAALASRRPVLLLEHVGLARLSGPLPLDGACDALRRAKVCQVGADVTLVALGWCNGAAQEAVALLGKQQISVEWIDPRSISPLDLETIARSVQKTGRLLLVEGDYRSLGVGAEIAAFICEHAWDELDAPVVCLREEQVHPTAIAEAVQRLLTG